MIRCHCIPVLLFFNRYGSCVQKWAFYRWSFKNIVAQVQFAEARHFYNNKTEWVNLWFSQVETVRQWRVICGFVEIVLLKTKLLTNHFLLPGCLAISFCFGINSRAIFVLFVSLHHFVSNFRFSFTTKKNAFSPFSL